MKIKYLLLRPLGLAIEIEAEFYWGLAKRLVIKRKRQENKVFVINVDIKYVILREQESQDVLSIFSLEILTTHDVSSECIKKKT